MRRESNGFVCIQCDPDAVVSSGVAQASVQNPLAQAIVAEAGAARSSALTITNLQEWFLAFIGTVAEEMPPEWDQLLQQVETWRREVDLRIHFAGSAERLINLARWRQAVQGLTVELGPEPRPEDIAEDLHAQIHYMWHSASDSAQHLITLGLGIFIPHRLPPPGFHVLATAVGPLPRIHMFPFRGADGGPDRRYE